jgi:hemerythrin
MLIEWSDALKVNIAEIDAQHGKLVSMLNDLHDAQGGVRKEILMPLLKALTDYAAEHFDTEEKLMERYKYPNLDKHRSEHQQFVSQVVGYQTMFDLELDSQILSNDILGFLSSWLQHHILYSDKEYGPHLNAKGIE